MYISTMYINICIYVYMYIYRYVYIYMYIMLLIVCFIFFFIADNRWLLKPLPYETCCGLSAVK